MFNIIRQEEFKKIKDVFLNRTGKKIGELVVYKGQPYYLTYRGGGIHFMRKTQSFGIDEILLEHWIEYENNMKFMGDMGLKIVFFYDGVREKRYYVISPSELLRIAVAIEGYAKETVKGFETYGRQAFVKIKDLHILGYAPNDIIVKNWKQFT